MTTERCDACKARSALAPKSVGDVFTWLSPPVGLVRFLEMCAEEPEKAAALLTQTGGGMSPDARRWLERWHRLRTGEPVPEVDRFDNARQGELIKGGVQYG